MKYYSLIITTVAFLIITSCGDKPARPAPALSADKIAQQKATFDSPEIPSGGVASGIQHYTCPNGHAGANTSGSCLICGATLEHNQAFHDQSNAAATPDAPAGGEPPQNADGVWHYTCPNGHAGGGGSATACPVCGTTLAHNAAYHGGSTTAPSTIDPMPTTNTDVVTPPVASAPAEPPQNADGVWHYTCPNGHAGGGGSATACSQCGTTLVHNTAYHN